MRKKYTDHRDVLANRPKMASFYLIPLLIAHPRLFAGSEASPLKTWNLMPLAAAVALVGTPEPIRIYNDISGRTTYKSLPIQLVIALGSLALHTVPLFLVDTDKFALQKSVTDPQAIAISSAVLAPFLVYYLFCDDWPYSSDPASMLSVLLAFLAVRRTSSLKQAYPSLVKAIVFGAVLATVVVWAVPAKIFPKQAEPEDCLRAPQPTKESQFDFIIDVRTENERRLLGAHARSLHLPIQGITKDKVVQLVGAAESRVRILTYCNTATRAKDAAQLIRSYGFPYTFYHPGTWDTIEA